MKKIVLLTLTILVTYSIIIGSFVFGQVKKSADPVIHFRVSLPQASQLIYAIRYSNVLTGKEANELADFLVNQANDTTLNKPIQQPKHK